MIGKTLGIYLAQHFARNTVLIFILFFFLIVAVDLIELSRQVGQTTDAGFGSILLISLYRAPAFAENVLPFSVLFGASATLVLLNRKLELVVARASGVSVWQFLLPIALAAAVMGAIGSFIYNPLSLSGTIASKAVQASIFGKVKGSFSNKSDNFWLRIGQKQGDVVLRARVSENAGTKLTAVSAYRFSADGSVAERLDASRALFVEPESGENHYVLSDVTATVPGEQGRQLKEVKLAVNISKSQLRADLTTADKISFWGLAEQAEKAAISGKNNLPFLTRIHALLSQPLLFVAMVLLAATVSLRFARFGVNGKAILGGVLAGFVLYVLSKLVVTFGSNGLVPPFIAAWAPALVASLISTTVLLHQEDG